MREAPRNLVFAITNIWSNPLLENLYNNTPQEESAWRTCFIGCIAGWTKIKHSTKGIESLPQALIF